MLLFTDRFEPRRILGEGALGSVEVAFDRAREREVALKRVRLRDPLHADVFQRELRLLRGVAHPRLVRLLDAGIADDEAGRFGYFTSELTIGTPLATPRAWSTLRATLIDTAHALLALHDASLMHGDVSAANVLVDASGRATLIDLGCARPLGEPLVTLDGTHPAPEILRGARASIAIDLFALGATFAPHLPSDTPAPIVQLIGSLRAPSERDRPTDLREVLERLGEEPPRRAATRAPLIGRDAAVRGFAQHLDRIERGVAGPRVVAIEAAPGLGTTRLLEELRWTAQLKMPVDEATGPTLGRVDRLLARIGADDLPAFLARARADGSSFALFIDELDRATPKERARALQLARALGDDDPWTLVVGGTVPREIAAERWPLAPLTNDEVARWIGPDVSAERRARIVDVTAGIPSEIERVLARPDLDPQHALSTASGTTGALDGLSPALRRALIEIACGGSIDAPELAHALTQLGWLRYEGGAHRLARPSDAARIEAAASPAERTDAHRALASRTSGASALLHLARAGDVDAAHEGLERIAAETTDRSSLGPLARALAELRPSLLAAEVLEEASEAGLAIRTLARLRRGASPETVDALRLRAGSCRLALGSPSGALRHLRRAAESQTPAVRDRAVERIAEALLRKGAHRSAADRLRAIERPSADAEALLGVALSYLGEHEESAALLARAARRDLSPRSRLRAVSFLAIDAYRRGALRDAAEGYREAYAIARAHHQEEQLPQTALNVATIEHRLGELGAALTRYSEALAWARAFAQPVTELTLRLNRARLHADLGLFDRARTALGQLAPRLQAEQLDFLAADAAGLDAEIAWMTGEGDAASAERAASEFEALGAEREAADARLLAGHCAMNRGEPDVAARALERAIEPTQPADLRARALELRARIERASGREVAALSTLHDALRLARAVDEPELVARLAVAAGDLASRLDAPHAAAALIGEARAHYDRIAATLPAELRASYRAHPLRAAAGLDLERSITDSPGASRDADARSADGATVRRLLRVAARVAEARDPDAVLELAMDSAVELTMAERGFLLLRDAADQLDVAVARNFDREDLRRASDKFSRTIAERVVGTGEPVLTSEAQRDERFQEGRSIHAMQLRSVLCVPIRTRAAMLGALYVDNRFQRGRFGQEHVELLTGFADQVAVALTNARLTRELEARSRELAEERERTLRLLADKTAEVERLTRLRTEHGSFHGLVGRSAKMRELTHAIEKLADAAVNVLILGESGSGKELVARAIHLESARQASPFVSINCGAIPEALLESELFGHVRGAFTGATRDKDGLFIEAGEGTLFLDEIGEMPLAMQVKLLRALQQREVRPVGGASAQPVRARVLAATNRRLRDAVARGTFREDLYYRLAVVELTVPPLRERPEDIPELAEALLQRAAAEDGIRARLTTDAVRALSVHRWPGNVRELENVLRAAAVFAEDGRIDARSLVLPERASPDGSAPLDEPARIRAALTAHGWNVAAAGRALGMPRMTLYRRLRAYGLERPES